MAGNLNVSYVLLDKEDTTKVLYISVNEEHIYLFLTFFRTQYRCFSTSIFICNMEKQSLIPETYMIIERFCSISFHSSMLYS